MLKPSGSYLHCLTVSERTHPGGCRGIAFFFPCRIAGVALRSSLSVGQVFPFSQGDQVVDNSIRPKCSALYRIRIDPSFF
jgi:hypothetical protein